MEQRTYIAFIALLMVVFLAASVVVLLLSDRPEASRTPTPRALPASTLENEGLFHTNPAADILELTEIPIQ